MKPHHSEEIIQSALIADQNKIAFLWRLFLVCLVYGISSIGVFVEGTTPGVLDEQKGEDILSGKNSKKNNENDDEKRTSTISDIIVVAAVDGTLAGISKESGRVLWKQSEKLVASSSTFMKPSTSSRTLLEDIGHVLKPLITTTTTINSASSASFTAIPSVDGTVYTTANDVTTSVRVKDLVARAPFLDLPNLFLGSRQASAVALDRETGQILRVLKHAMDEKERSVSSLPTLDDRHVVWLGRVDNIISIQNVRTGMVEAQFSIAEIMNVVDMNGIIENENWKSDQIIRSRNRESNKDDETGYFPNFDQQVLSLPASPLVGRLDSTVLLSSERTSPLVVTPNGNVAFRDFNNDDKLAWVASESFDSPIAFAIDAVTGAVVEIDVISDFSDLSTSTDDNTASLCGTPVVGSMSNGQLYALPLRCNIKTASSATAITLTSSVAAAASSSNVIKYSQPVSHLPGRPNANLQQNDNARTVKKKCVANSPTFPSCLIKIDRSILSKEALSDEITIASKSQRQFQEHEHSESLAVLNNQFHKRDAGFYHPHYGYVSPNELGGFYHPKYGYVSPRDLYGTNNRGDKKSYQKLFRLMGSWLPPTIALLFVVSFELGRRKRLDDEKQQQKNRNDTNEHNDRIKDTLPRTGRLDTEQNNFGESNRQEVISVSDEVLGYGGHGTVVYKGILDGREVAVKRMLKAYHASADREISLLIESDGDKNVVRYFLKEVRDDFVYLALELCDLSLHELIGLLRENRQQQIKPVLSELEEVYHYSTESMESTIRILLQITSGVKHLHSLRIVHRDLKPANILLAISKQGKKKNNEESSIFMNFVHNYYDAKISDMGLGKQLVGQSSIGSSLVGESSFRGSKVGVSSIGVGPGTVGWQAPEVLTLRWTADKSQNSAFNAANSKECQSTEFHPSTQTSRSVDIFSLGCIFYSLLLPGLHPFGEWFEREANIMRNRPNLDALKKISLESFYLVRSMLERSPKMRPTAKEICLHPFFWNSQKKVAFVCDISDRLEGPTSNSIKSLAIESRALNVIGTSWETKLDSALIDNVQKFRTYDYSCVRDLLRLIRNKHHHFDELPEDFRHTVPNQDSLCRYFTTKFPGLVMHCYIFSRQNLSDEDTLFRKFGITSAKLDTKSACEDPMSGIINEKDLDLPRKLETKRNSIDRIKTGIFCGESQIDSMEEIESESTKSVSDNANTTLDINSDIIIWEGSIAQRTFDCRGWSRSQDQWSRNINPFYKKRDPASKRCLDDSRFRTRLCNHWDSSLGTICPMEKKGKCVFAHGPVELRVKDGKKNRWGKLVDKKGNNSNPWHSGGEDTFGAASKIEKIRNEEGKWSGSKDRKSSGLTPRKKQNGTNQTKQR